MSKIYFHSPSGETKISGAERAHMGQVVSKFLISALPLGSFRDVPPPILRVIPSSSYLHAEYCRVGNGPIFQCYLETWLRVSHDSFVLPDGPELNMFELGLNTAYDCGSDPIKLMARLHGQCEIHTFVEGINRTWLADIIAEGLRIHVLRKEMGWPSVIDFLRERDDEPVVTSYSVCEQFPNRHAANWQPDPDGDPDGWYELSHEEQWMQAMTGIRDNEWLEMKPDNWQSFFFANGMNGYELAEIVQAMDKE